MTRKIILASQSPRRAVLLKQLGINFEVVPSSYEEDMKAKSDPYELAKFLALNKAQDVVGKVKDAIVIAADTFTIFNNRFIGKPKSIDEARKVLREFSGKEHEIITGYAIIDTKTNKTFNDYSSAKIKFRTLDDLEIEEYLKTEHVLDLAGSYAIQQYGSLLIDSVSGDYFAIVGLPLVKVYYNLKDLNYNILGKKE